MLQPKRFPETRLSLLATLREGSGQNAWRDFFERYAPPVYRVARLRNLAHADAEDIVQQVMIAVSKHIGAFKYDRDRGKFRQWVAKIAENKIHDWRRRRNSRHETEFDESRDDHPQCTKSADLWDREWHVQDLLWCIDQVKGDFAPRRFEAFRLYAMEGVSAEETAQRTGMTRSYVYANRTQVVKRIREVMQNLDDTRH